MDSLEAVTTAGQLVLALLVLTSGPRSPLATSLALLCLDIAGWNGATLAFRHGNLAAFFFADRTLSPLTAPLALDFVLLFIGERRASHIARSLAYAICGSLSFVSAAAIVFVDPPVIRSFVASPHWGTWLLGGSIPTMGYALIVLVRHLRRTLDPVEQARTRLVLLAIGVGTVFGATEPLHLLDPSVPCLGTLGALLAAIALLVATMRFRLVEGVRIAGALLIVASAVALALAVAFRVTRTAAVLVAIMGPTLTVLFVSGRSWFRELVAGREKRAELVALGRFSAQMSHDLRNPLAALRGAAQVIRRDLAAPRGAIDRMEFIDLVLEQADRLERMVDTYDRLARVDVVRADVSLNSIVRGVLKRQEPVRGSNVIVETCLDDEMPACAADPDMMATVVENLVKNALEAMPSGGTLRVRTVYTADRRSDPIGLWVEDTGLGMDARTKERAFDDFFTTKPTGSGLGLAFVDRIVRAHGGRVFLSSQVGRGTTVQIVLPKS